MSVGWGYLSSAKFLKYIEIQLKSWLKCKDRALSLLWHVRSFSSVLTCDLVTACIVAEWVSQCLAQSFGTAILWDHELVCVCSVCAALFWKVIHLLDLLICSSVNCWCMRYFCCLVQGINNVVLSPPTLLCCSLSLIIVLCYLYTLFL